jgi:protein-S-isoprenylcysteine O-methyltransferase Ste14
MTATLARATDSPAVVIHPPLLFGVGLAAGLVVHWIRPVSFPHPVIARVAGLVIFVLSLQLARSAEAAMRRAGTNIRPDQPTLAIVTDGPFRFSRNPLYLATVGLYLGIALLVNTLWPLLLLAPVLVVLQWGVIGPEERYLQEKFGESYREYRARVRRWV